MDLLNSEYEQLLQRKMSIFVTYSEMVEKFPYRVLASYSYDAAEKPLRSDRIADNAALTDAAASDIESMMESQSQVIKKICVRTFPTF